MMRVAHGPRASIATVAATVALGFAFGAVARAALAWARAESPGTATFPDCEGSRDVGLSRVGRDSARRAAVGRGPSVTVLDRSAGASGRARDESAQAVVVSSGVGGNEPPRTTRNDPVLAVYREHGRVDEYFKNRGDIIAVSSLYSRDEFGRLIALAAAGRTALVCESQAEALARVTGENHGRSDSVGTGQFEFFAIADDEGFVGMVGREAQPATVDHGQRRDLLATAAHVITPEAGAVMRRHGHEIAEWRELGEGEVSILESVSDELFVHLAVIRQDFWNAVTSTSAQGRGESFSAGDVSAVLLKGGKLTIARRGDIALVDSALVRLSVARRAARGELERLLR